MAQLPSAAQTVRLAQPNAARFPEVTLYAYPTDIRGAFMSGLGPGELHVLEEGRPVLDPRVEARGGSIDVCLALDRSPSMLDEEKLEFARSAARIFLTQLARGDRAALLSFADGAVLDQSLTADHPAVLAALDRITPGKSATTFRDALYWSISQVGLPGPGTGSVVTMGSGRPDARRVVVALTDGNDNGSRVQPQELLTFARASGVSLCLIAVGSDAQTFQMEHLARETGGIFLRAPAPQDLARLYASLAEQLRREYRITYRSPDPRPDGGRRDVRVEAAPAADLGAPSASSAWGDTWYQAPGQGSLIVTVPGANPSAPVTGVAERSGGLSPGLLFGAILMALVLLAAAIGSFVWYGTRQRRLPIYDSNPRVDLLPLRVRGGSTRIGRGAECELVLDSTQVSRVHARIEAIEGAFRLVDEGSRNGTYVNGRRVRRSRVLREGDVVRFGDREFQFAGELRS